MKKKFTKITFLIYFVLLAIPLISNAQSLIDVSYKVIKVKPSETEPLIKNADEPHLVFYDSKLKNNKILLWLTGTNGTTNNIPKDFINTALESGYKVIALSFISTPGVSQVCIGDRLNSESNCASKFRRMRIYGTPIFPLIPDKSYDAIVPRFIKLLEYLAKNDGATDWSYYMKEDKPDWSKIAIAGQSQGGGMAQFIGKNETVFKIISFSGGWDFSDSQSKKIADWYDQKNKTPKKNWYATYHINEKTAVLLKKISKTLQIPKDHIFELNLPTDSKMNLKNNNPYHVQGIKNVVYKPIWQKMLGSGE